MGKFKKMLAFLLALALALPLQGCGYRELYERLLIHGIGVDLAEDGFLVTVRSSISPEDEGEEYFRCEGRSVLEALTNLSLSTGREPFYSHNCSVKAAPGRGWISAWIFLSATTTPAPLCRCIWPRARPRTSSPMKRTASS